MNQEQSPISILEKFASRFMIERPKYNSNQCTGELGVIYFITTIFFDGESQDSSKFSKKNKSKEDAANKMIHLLITNSKLVFLSKLNHIAFLQYKFKMFNIIRGKSANCDIIHQKRLLQDSHDIAALETETSYLHAISSLKQTFFLDIIAEKIDTLLKYGFDEIVANLEIGLNNVYDIQYNIKRKYNSSKYRVF